METLPRIPTIFAGKNIFITGASGFLGKVLIEKLLRSCPDVGDIYLLLRPKKGKIPEDRLKEIIKLPLFDKLRENNPNALKKLKPIAGNTTQINLGLSSTDRQQLINNINIIYHCAASVRFDDPLTDAIIMNTRGAREVSYLALEMKQLDVFVHVSTTYCNTNRKIIDEVLYPPHADWKMAIKIAEELDKNVVEVLTEKYLGELPNTYTFTKQLAEHVVNDLCKGKLPVVIIRPSVVISSLDDPFPGWIDNFNGPVGMIVAGGKGFIHTYYAKSNLKINYIPVDVCIKGIIVATWYKIIKTNRNDLTVYNACSSDSVSLTFEEVINYGMELLLYREEFTMGSQLWIPCVTITETKFKYYIQFIFYQLLPTLFIDLILKLTNRKPFLYKMQKKIFIAGMALEYFCFNRWTFINANFMDLNQRILEEDKNDFYFFHEYIDLYNYFRNSVIFGSKYLLHANIDDDNQRKRQRRLKYLHYFVVYTFYILLFLFVFKYLQNLFK